MAAQAHSPRTWETESRNHVPNLHENTVKKKKNSLNLNKLQGIRSRHFDIRYYFSSLCRKKEASCFPACIPWEDIGRTGIHCPFRMGYCSQAMYNPF